MGIDVYTADLAAQLRNVDAATASTLRRGDRYPLTADGIAAARKEAESRSGGLGPLGAFLLARRMGRELGVRVGSPFASLGTSFYQEPDKLDARQWSLLQLAAASAEGGTETDAALAAIDPDAIFETRFLDATWDGFPGIDFARAIERANTLVVPMEKALSFATGHLALTSVEAGRAFLGALVERLSLTPEDLEDDDDPEMSDAVHGILYNPRLLAFHLMEAERSGRPLGIWG